MGKCFSRSTSFGGLLSAKALFVLGFAFVFMASLVFSSVFSSSVYASTYSLSMSTSGTVSVDVSVSGNGASVTEDDLVVTSTCPLGYTITIQGPTDTTLYKDGNSANNTTTTKISPSTGTIVSPASILGNNQGTWGYALGDNITTASDFIGLTSTSNTLITKAQQSGDGTVLTDTIPVYYGVSVQPNQVPGLYTMAESQVGAGDNVVTYFITTPTSCTSYTVSFNPTSTAGGNTLSGTGTMGSQTIPEGVATPLNTNSFTAPEGYVFKEWNTSQDGTGTSYTDGQSVTDLTTVGQNITLYAQWKPREYTITFITNNAESIVFNGVAYTNGQTTTVIAGTYHIYGNYTTRYAFSSWSATAGTFENQTYQNTAYTVTGDATITLTGQQVTTAIQNLAYASCTTTATPVYDNRDNSVYWIQKLPDNNCWMLDNLALDLTNSTIVNSLSNTNTNLNINALTYFKNGGGTALDRYPITSYGVYDSTGSYSQPLTNSSVKDSVLRPSSTENYTGSTEGSYGPGQGKIGVYYNYCAASVGNYCFGDGSSPKDANGDNYYDICPTGWRMPTGGSTGEYMTLYSTSTVNSNPTTYLNTLSVPLSGVIYNGSTAYVGQYGVLSSATSHVYRGNFYSDGLVSYLAALPNTVMSRDVNSNTLGSPVRCILDHVYAITINTSNADSVVLNGVAYTNGQTAYLSSGTYHIYGNYATRYAFSSWTATAGTFENQTYQNTAYTVTGDATITLTGQQVTTAIQNLAYTNCPTTATPVYDTRDNSVYWIQRLPDNNCWMLDNLALDLTDSTIVNNLSTANTNLDPTSLTYFKNGGGTSSDRYPIMAYSTYGDTDSYSQPLTYTTYKDVSIRPDTTEFYTRYSGSYGSGQNKVGAYYNYCAASVGYYCFGNGRTPVSYYGNNYYDVCPAGWRMPTGYGNSDTSREFNTLFTNPAINSDKEVIRNVLSWTLSGDYYSSLSSGMVSMGSGNSIWTSENTSTGYMIGFDNYYNSASDHIGTAVNIPSYYGLSVRCVVSPSLTITVDSNVSDVSLKVQSTHGATITGTKTGNTIIFKNLQQGIKYYLYPTFNTGYEFDSWAKTDNATGSSLDSTNVENAYYIVGSGNGALELTSKQMPITITFKTSNASSIVFNGVAYTNNQTLTIPASDVGNTYHIYGNYATRYAFSSWTATAGTFENQNYQNTAFTVTGDATITLTGQYVNTAMQNLSISNCSTTAMPVYDNRDSSVYWVQKLADGNCWMLDNLALDLTNSTVVNNLSASNTHLDATSLTYFKNGGGTASDRYPITAYSTFGSTNSYSQPLTYANSKNTTLRPSVAKNYTGTYTGAYGQGQGKVGVYYNYCAASVGYFCFGDGTSPGTTDISNTYDVCPASWHMPTSSSYRTLLSSYSNNSTNFRKALSTPLSGGFYSGSVADLGQSGRFWSSSITYNIDDYNPVGTDAAYALDVYSYGATYSVNSNRSTGYSVRCILGN